MPGRGPVQGSLNGVQTASLTATPAGVKKENIQLEAEGQILRIRRVAQGDAQSLVESWPTMAHGGVTHGGCLLGLRQTPCAA